MYRQSDYGLLHVIHGKKPSSRFGFSLAIANGQLVVGCPRYKSGFAVEKGAIFMYNDVKVRTVRSILW